MVQDKLITYPDAIAKALAADINRYINTLERVDSFVTRALTAGAVNEAPLFLGFVQNPSVVKDLSGQDIQNYLITLPSNAPRHVQKSHGNDGNGQRPAQPADYQKVVEIFNSADRIELGNTASPRLVTYKMIEGEEFIAVFDVLSGKRNKAVALVSLVIKTAE
jgi:hypothetical protein